MKKVAQKLDKCKKMLYLCNTKREENNPDQ